MKNDLNDGGNIMTTYNKLYLIVLIFMIITIILSYLIDWNITRNSFTLMSMWRMFLLMGLIAGQELTRKEMRK